MSQDVVPVDAPQPATVRVAVALQFALVATLTLMAAVAVAEAVHYDSLIDQAARAVGADPGDVALERSGNVSGALFTAITALLLAAWLGITAWWMRRRSNTARILALVGLGAPLVLSVLACLVGGLIGVIFAGILLQAPGEFDSEEAGSAEWGGEALFEELDRLSGGGWSIAFDAVGSAALLLVLLLAVATVVLLLVSSSRLYFRPVLPIAVHPYAMFGPAPASSYLYPHPAVPFPRSEDPMATPRPQGPEASGTSSGQ